MWNMASERLSEIHCRKCLIIIIGILVWILSTPGTITAATDESANTSNLPAKTEAGYHGQITSDGGYIIASYCIAQNGNQDVYILKVNARGKKEWEKTYGGQKDDQANCIQECQDGNYIVTGYTKSKQGKGQDIYLLKISKQGELLWEKNYGGRFKEEKTADVTPVKQIFDVGYEVFDYTSSVDLSRDYFDVFLLRPDKGELDKAGKDSEYTDDEGNYVQACTDGGYIIVGNTRPRGGSNADICLVKVDSQGILQWARSIGGGNDENASSVQQTTDGGYIICGNTNSVGIGNRERGDGKEQKNRTDKDLYLVKTDNRGYFEWERTFGGLKDDEGKFACQTRDGNYITSGYISKISGEGNNLYLVKTNSSGNIIWESNNWAGRGSAIGNTVKPTQSGDFMVTGTTVSSDGKSAIFIMRYQDKSELLWDRQWEAGANTGSAGLQIMKDGTCIVIGHSLMTSLDGKTARLNPIILQYDDNGKLRDNYIIYDNQINRLAGITTPTPESKTATSASPPAAPAAKGARK